MTAYELRISDWSSDVGSSDLREGNHLYHEMMESGVIKTDGPGSKVDLVYGQMNEPPGARARVALTGLTLAEYFRDQEGQDVLFFVDNIFRFTQAGSEMSALPGRSEERRVGKECVSTCRSRWWPYQ